VWKLYSPLFGEHTTAFRERVEQYRVLIQQCTPELYNEMRGISDGSGIKLSHIIALNARSELIVSDIVNKDEKINECTTIYSEKIRTLAQTWDFQNTI
jgi:hypothetical protein